MKKISFVFILLFSVIISNAQTVTIGSGNMKSGDWVLYQETGGVQMFYKFSDCNIPDQGPVGEYVLIKLVNTSNADRKVDWDNVLWYNNSCINCENLTDEYHKSIVIPALGAVESGCRYDEKSVLNIFSGALNMTGDQWKLTGFEFRNFIVK